MNFNSVIGNFSIKLAKSKTKVVKTNKQKLS